MAVVPVALVVLALVLRVEGRSTTRCLDMDVKYGCNKRTGACFRYCPPTYMKGKWCPTGMVDAEDGKCVRRHCKSDKDCALFACRDDCCGVCMTTEEHWVDVAGFGSADRA